LKQATQEGAFMNSPLIGLTGCLSSELCKDLAPEYPFFHLKTWYCEAIRKAGGRPVIIPPVCGSDEEAEAIGLLSHFDGIYVTGGGMSTAPPWPVQPKLMETQPIRSAMECRLVRTCRDQKLPLIGSCRGHQIICEALGGTMSDELLYNHQQEDTKIPFYYPSHAVTIVEGSRLASIIGDEEWAVNSMHCSYVEKCPDGFSANAYGPEGTIEGMETLDEEWFCISYQYHPEIMLFDERAEKVMKAFVEAAEAYARSRKDG
jgi:putative glutamine amidotransferase